MPIETWRLLLPLANSSTIAPTEQKKLDKTVAENQMPENRQILRTE